MLAFEMNFHLKVKYKLKKKTPEAKRFVLNFLNFVQIHNSQITFFLNLFRVKTKIKKSSIFKPRFRKTIV